MPVLYQLSVSLATNPGSWISDDDSIYTHSCFLHLFSFKSRIYHVFQCVSSATIITHLSVLPSTKAQTSGLHLQPHCLTCSPLSLPSKKIRQRRPIRHQSVTHSDKIRFSKTQVQGCQVSSLTLFVVPVSNLTFFLCDAFGIRDWVAVSR